MKKIAFGAMLATQLLLAGTAFAEGFNGFYVGGEVGQTSLEAKFNNEPAGAVAARAKAEKSAFAYGAYAGWGATALGPVYLGAELGFGAGGSDIARTLSGAQFKLEPQERFMISARAGVVLGQSNLVYVRGGYEARQYDVKLPNVASREEDFNGAIYGVGYERLLGDKFSIRGEFIGSTNKDTTLRYGPGNANRVKIEPQESRIMFGGSYHF